MKLFFTLAAIMAISFASVLPIPNTPSASASCEYYSTIAKQSSTLLPGYSVVTVDASASVQSDAYLKHHYLSSYDVTGCREFCDKTSRCQAFNVYFERSPGVEPGGACPNPEARAIIVCGLYGRAIQSADVVNAGKSWGPEDVDGEAFTVVIRGSNVWNKHGTVESEEKPVTITATVTVTSTTLLTTTVEVSHSVPAVETTSSLPASSSNGSSSIESTFVVASSTIHPYPFGLGSPLWYDAEQTTKTVESTPVISGKSVSSPDFTVTPWLDLWTRDLMTITRTITDGSTTSTMTITIPLVQ